MTLEETIGPHEARRVVGDMLMETQLSGRIRIWLGAEAQLPPRTVQPLRELAGQVVRLRGRACEEALAELCAQEPGVGFWDVARGACRYPLAWPVGIYDFRWCGRPAVCGSWCDEHASRVFGKGS